MRMERSARFPLPGCATQGRVFAGQRAEYFAVNLGPLFDLVNFVPDPGGGRPRFTAADVRLTPEAEIEGLTPDGCLQSLIAQVEIPR